ncbi:MAG: YfhO family protein [Candidatus Marinimicrobia bacterium]|nr:YfhO family protein [Candidatus Neomarinimicrobiota bacterium]
MSKKKRISKEKLSREKASLLDKISLKNGCIFSAVIILLTLLIFYKPYVFDKLEPAGGDRIASIGQTHQITEYQKQTGERALWNPNIFGGVPTYYWLSNNTFHIDKLISWLNPLLDWRVGWLLLGAAGMFCLILYLGFPWYFALIGTVAFLFLPHFQALIIVGHNVKIRAIMALPWVVLGFAYFVNKLNFFSLLVFALAFSLQLRTQHYQIIFYALLAMLAIGILKIIEWIKNRESGKIFKSLGLFVAGLIIAVFMSAQPLFVVKEYTPYSTRGGRAINLRESKPGQAEEKKSGGVTFEYATQWSVSLKELITLISPRFLGGTSAEMYNGKSVPQLRGRRLPTYWGDMPFTQSSEYLGILIVILALAGIWYNRKNGLVISLSALLLFSILLSFGRHFPPLYKLLFYYLPYFSKFRVPMMILVLISFIVIILAMFGLRSIIERPDEKRFKTLLYISGFFALVGLVPLLLPNILSYTSPKDARFAANPEVMELLRKVRLEFMRTDTIRMLGFIAAFVALIVAYFKQKINKDLLIVGVFLLIAVDMIGVSWRFMSTTRLVNTKSIEQNYFRETKFDRIISADPEYHRVLGLGQLFQSNDLAYRHQLVGGYSAIKPQLIQDIVDNNLYTNNPQEPVNWNVVNMLNAKYIVTPGNLQAEGLIPLEVNQNQRTILYKNENALPRAFFVNSVKKFDDEKDVARFMNSPEFEPAEFALTTEDIDTNTVYDVSATVRITEYTPNRISLQVENNGKAFMVLSEAYYPKGWTATIDSKPTHIYQVNHVLRGIEVSVGTHEIVFEFRPKSYTRAAVISSVFTYLMWILIIGNLVYANRSKLTFLK